MQVHQFHFPLQVNQPGTYTIRKLILLGVLLLENLKVENAQSKAKKEFAFEIATHDRSMMLSASTEIEMNSWKNVLMKFTNDSIRSSQEKATALQQEVEHIDNVPSSSEKTNVSENSLNRSSTLPSSNSQLRSATFVQNDQYDRTLHKEEPKFVLIKEEESREISKNDSMDWPEEDPQPSKKSRAATDRFIYLLQFIQH